jgi:hypothetical protein
MHTPGPWRMQRCRQFAEPLYTVSRRVNGVRVHLEYARDGSPMLWGFDAARCAIARAAIAKAHG